MSLDFKNYIFEIIFLHYFHRKLKPPLPLFVCIPGNPNDKILYASIPKRSTSFPLERRNSLKLFGSNKRLNGSLTRSGSMKYIPHKSGTLLTDSSSSTEYTTSQDYQPLSTSKSKRERERECVRAWVRVRVIPETEIVKKKIYRICFRSRENFFTGKTVSSKRP